MDSYEELLRENVFLRKIANRFVFCKDCKYWFSSSGLGGVCEYIRQTQHVGVDTLPNHFCGWGERGSWGDVD